MNKSPIYSRYEKSAHHLGYEFDYQEDFTQFLEEARKNSCKLETSNAANDLEEARKQQPDGERSLKKMKSWKNSLFSWLKKNNNKSTKLPTKGNPVSRARRGNVSGPVQGNGGGIAIGRGQRAAASGPLTSLFSTTRKVEDYELPYMCLTQINSSQKLPSYGPVYLVT